MSCYWRELVVVEEVHRLAVRGTFWSMVLQHVPASHGLAVPRMRRRKLFRKTHMFRNMF